MLLRRDQDVDWKDSSMYHIIRVRKTKRNQQPTPHPGHVFGIDTMRVGIPYFFEGIPALVIGKDIDLTHDPRRLLLIGKRIKQLRDKVTQFFIPLSLCKMLQNTSFIQNKIIVTRLNGEFEQAGFFRACTSGNTFVKSAYISIKLERFYAILAFFGTNNERRKRISSLPINY